MDPATTEIYPYCHTLSLHDALPICKGDRPARSAFADDGRDHRYAQAKTGLRRTGDRLGLAALLGFDAGESARGIDERQHRQRSEEHTSELQSLMRISYAVFCLKKTNRPISEQTS